MDPRFRGDDKVEYVPAGIQENSTTFTMLKKSQITKCEALPDYRLKLFFADGMSGVVDLSYLKGEGVFKIWEDYKEFKKVTVDPITHTVCWNNEIDLDPINLRKKLLAESRLQNL